jgi:hypothetical protein
MSTVLRHVVQVCASVASLLPEINHLATRENRASPQL